MSQTAMLKFLKRSGAESEDSQQISPSKANMKDDNTPEPPGRSASCKCKTIQD